MTPAGSRMRSSRRRRSASAMRRYWDERARENAVFFVDTSCDYDSPDIDRFMASGMRIVEMALVDAPAQPAGRHVAVELGCGLGRNCLALADHFDEVCGVDVSTEMLERARALVPDPRVRFLASDGLGMGPVETASADFVLSFTVFQHMPSMELVVANIEDVARVLRPGGIAALQWNNSPRGLWWVARGYARRAARIARLPGWRDVRYAGPFLGRPVAWRDMENALTGAGLVPRATAGLGTLFAWVWAERP